MGLIHRAISARVWPILRCSRHLRASPLIFLSASLLIAGKNAVNVLAWRVLRAARARKGVAQERERGVFISTTPVAVLAVHQLGLGRMQPQPDLRHPVLDRLTHVTRL